MTSRPTTIGSVRTPDAVADTPCTYCRYVGRNVIAPSMANPTMKASTTHTLNTEDRNRCSGRIGSLALASTNTKMPSETIDAANRPMIVADPQAYWVPPQDSASVRPEAPNETNTIPK